MFQILLLTSKRCYDKMREKGDDVKDMNNDERTRFTLRIPEKLFRIIQKKADAAGVSTNALILQILWQWLEQKAM